MLRKNVQTLFNLRLIAPLVSTLSSSNMGYKNKNLCKYEKQKIINFSVIKETMYIIY